jgi:hypothetical protein
MQLSVIQVEVRNFKLIHIVLFPLLFQYPIKALQPAADALGNHGRERVDADDITSSTTAVA